MKQHLLFYWPASLAQCLNPLAQRKAGVDVLALPLVRKVDFLVTKTGLSGEQTAFKYNELWRVAWVLMDVKSLLEISSVFHQNEAHIAGHVFCSFLALML